MKKLDFQKDWQWRKLPEGAWQTIDLPHDAAMTEKRVQCAPGGVNTGWYEGGDYEYQKCFVAPAEWKEQDTILEFEGVYRNAEVYINGILAAKRAYGYTNFYADIKPFLNYGGKNQLTVIAHNADQPNSRWYSGAGIYRPVWLWIGEQKRIAMNGVKVSTVSIQPAVVSVRVDTTCPGGVGIEILRNGRAVQSTVAATQGSVSVELPVPEACLWSPENPELYTCRVTFGQDVQEVTFGIRTISWDTKNGFCINGRRVILRGACIHSDNGLLGARCYRDAEERKVRLLKEAGYNAIRSAHNPCSRYLLDYCDRVGMLVMDEYVDMWYIHKTKYDYAGYIEENYVQDITDMIEKDFNHPSVILYSLGNEVAETGEEKGIAFYTKMQQLCHSLDASRPVTAGVNIFFNYLYALGFGQYSDEKADKNPEAKVGSEFFNTVAGITGAAFMKTMAKLPGCDRKTRDCFAVMDIAGYNYGILRYQHDIRKYPDRVILGSETFCADAYAFWEFAKTHPAVIGDFVWAGMDYLGEVGVGAWEYKSDAPDFTHGVGWVSAGSGRIDLVGNPLGEMLYTRAAFELERGPKIAVAPVNHTGEAHSPSAWKFTNAIPSWSWRGCEGKKANVEVYTRAATVVLYLNSREVGRKKRKNDCRVRFAIPYENGILKAVELDADGKELGNCTLKTAGEETVLTITPERKIVRPGELVYFHLDLTDKNGTVKPMESGEIKVQIVGGKLLALGSAAPYEPDGYDRATTKTYYGRAMAIVQATEETITLTAGWDQQSAEATVLCSK